MMRTPFTDLFDIEVPVLQAATWPATTPALVAAVSEAGGMGSLGAVFETAEIIRARIDQVRALTARPFVVNHVVPKLDEDTLRATLEFPPAAVSFALGSPGELVERVHATGAKVIHQVHTVAQAVEAAELGVDVIIAQGSEAGGQGMIDGVSTMALVPQVADAVAPIPVLAAGGIADGRGLAAALVLGAAGANVGTRFLASTEAGAADGWKERIVATASEDAVRFEAWTDIMPADGGYAVAPRVIRTEFVAEWSSRRGEVPEHAEDLRRAIMGSVQQGRSHEVAPFTGQSAGLVRDVRPAADIVRAMLAGAQAALRSGDAAAST